MLQGVPTVKYMLVLLASIALYIWQGLLPRTDFFWLLASWVALTGLAYLLYLNVKGLDKTWWWLTGMLLRLAVVWYLPNLSDDYLRYLFDGQLNALGMNPFQVLPVQHLDAVQTEADQVALVQAKNYYSVYPPLPQWGFTIAWWLGQNLVISVLLLKVLWLAMEGITLWWLPKALERWQVAPQRSLLYCLHPLVVIELIGNAHIEVGMVVGLTVALYALSNARYSLAGFGLGVAAGFKLLPALFIVSWTTPSIRRYAPAIIVSTLVLVVPFLLYQPLITLPNLFTGLQLYVNHFAFNGGLFTFLTDLLQLSPHWAGRGLSIGFGLVFLLLTWLYSKKHLLLPHFWLLILTAYYLTATTVNPWYITPIVLLGAFTPWTFPWVWSGVIWLSYSAFQYTDMQVPTYVLVLEYALLFSSILFDLYRHGKLHPMASDPTRTG